MLVDVQNLYYSARNLFGSRISFKNLLEVATEGRVLTRAIAYVIKADVATGEGEFFSAVHDAGFEVKEKELQVFPGGAKKGDWDLGIAMDAIRLGTKVDSIVLVSGDGDYVPVVSYLQQSLGCLVEVVAFEKTCSKALREVADDFISIESHAKELLFKTEKSARTAVAGQFVSSQRATEQTMVGQSTAGRPIAGGGQRIAISSQKADRSEKRSGRSSFRPIKASPARGRDMMHRIPEKEGKKPFVKKPIGDVKPRSQRSSAPQFRSQPVKKTL